MADKANENFKVSATGGAGSAGQPAQYATGIDRAQDFMELQTSAKLNKSGVELPRGVGKNAPVMSTEDVVPLGAFTQNLDEHPATGAAYGPGGGSEMLASNAMLDMQNDEDYKKFKAVLPIYKAYAESPYASNAFRNFTRWADSQ
jgi:hypothetical protein